MATATPGTLEEADAPPPLPIPEEDFLPEGLTEEEWAETFPLLVEKAATNFDAFFLLFSFLNGNKMGELQYALLDIVQDVQDGRRGKRNAISVPPQHGKSEVFARLMPAWLMGFSPGIQIAVTSFSHELAEGFSESVRNYVSHPWYALIFPEFGGISPRMNRISTWGLRNKSRLRAKSIGKKLTGNRVDVLIVDDAHAGREEAESSILRKRIVRWYFADCVTRFSPETQVYLVGTRFHQEDLIGSLTGEDYVRELTSQGREDEIFELTNFPAIAGYHGDPLGREPGDALCPEMGRTKSFLEAMRASQQAYEWDSQYQGLPRASSSGQVDLSKLSYIPFSSLPFDLLFSRGWDLALGEKRRNDFTAGALGALGRDGTFYIVDIWHGKKGWIPMKNEIVAIAEREAASSVFQVHRIGVEAVAGFGAALAELQESLKGRVRVDKRNPKHGQDKLARAQPWLNLIDAGKVVIVEGKWNKAFIAELDVFPGGCFVAGTLVTTRRGEVPIERVRVGDECLTRLGWKRVMRAWQTGVRRVISRFGLEATPEHRVWTQNGWKELQNVGEYDKLTLCARQSYSRGIPTTAIRNTGFSAIEITSDALRGLEVRPGQSCSIKRSGEGLTEKSPAGWRSTTKMGTPGIIALRISNALPPGSTWLDISLAGCAGAGLPSELGTILLERYARNAMNVGGTKGGMPLVVNPGRRTALYARPGLLSPGSEKVALKEGSPSIVAMSANTPQLWKDSGDAVPVFDLTVEDAHEFFANGVLVHNSHDDMVDGVSILYETLTRRGRTGPLYA